MSRSHLLLMLVLSLLIAAVTRADSWPLPSTKSYTSESGRFKFTVEPLPMNSRLSHFERKAVDARGLGSDSVFPKGTLRSASGDLLWETSLVNEVSPVSALVSSSGSYVVTFDNWHAMGYGNDVVVIYGPNGTLVRQFSLEELVGADRLAEFPRSVSSIRWSGQHRFESNDVLAISVVAEGSDPYEGDARFETVRVRLQDGVVLRNDPLPNISLKRTNQSLRD